MKKIKEKEGKPWCKWRPEKTVRAVWHSSGCHLDKHACEDHKQELQEFGTRNAKCYSKFEGGMNYQIHDIPNYPTLFIRDGDFVFVTNKDTGEISIKLSVGDYCTLWCNEFNSNLDVNKFYTKGYVYPKDSPDTARDITTLKALCSDNIKHIKGDQSYFLDFLNSDLVNTTHTKMFMWLCKQVVVWNYSVFYMEELYKNTPRSRKQTKAAFQQLQDKKLVHVITNKFEGKQGWMLLVKVHPKLYWKGRYTAWAVKSGLDYEYEDSFLLSENGVSGN